MLKRRFEGNIIPLDVLKPVPEVILEGIRYLHNECHIIHTGIYILGLRIVVADALTRSQIRQHPNGAGKSVRFGFRRPR